ncbi:EAL domain-containing protein [Aquibacillus rhizosphaerae]|uniref:EAL domain-containing protein n=1 Tax=Aquibacillus rhizosphaerae TaxID=3051431 RepID=A0ABT7L8P3_9BACI|nr:EAL domain-containing protein [Aquibacillus sp. LR5S19]MDL4842248.1 EAL domain-containing protein [Aquibacillus sp. LR5S19]
MVRKKQIKLRVMWIVLFIIISYAYLIVFKNEQGIFIFLGEFIYSMVPLVAATGLFLAYKKSVQIEKPFWLLLSAAYISCFFAQVVWDIYDVYFEVPIPFPGVADIFFLFQYILFLSAFIYKVVKEKQNSALFRYLIDILIILTVVTTFSWHYIIYPFIHSSDYTGGFLALAIGYPLGDLLLMILAISTYLDSSDSLKKNSLFLIFAGFFILVITDSIYLYLQLLDGYSSWSLIDPLYLLSYLLIGFAGLQRSKVNVQSIIKVSKEELEESKSTFKLILPYLCVLALCIFLLFYRDFSIVLGAIVAILLIISRQFATIIVNKQLLEKNNQQTKQLLINEQRYRSLFDYHTDAVFSLDLDGNFQTINPKCKMYFGTYDETLINETLFAILPTGLKSDVMGSFNKAKTGVTSTTEVSYTDFSGMEMYLHITFIPIFETETVKGVFGIAKNITSLKVNEQKVSYLANHDPLTELPNRRYFDQLLEKAFNCAQAKNSMLSVFFIDLDHFKSINDTLGHDIGDLILIEVAQRLNASISTRDVVARQGGDEFIILLQDIKSEQEIRERAELILTKLNKHYFVSNHRVSVTPSIGISTYPKDAKSIKSLLKNADMAMYRAKYQGKNDFRIYHSLSDEKSFKRLTIEKDIHTVLENNQLEVYYQPQYETNTGSILGVEALVRWNHPEFGLVSPGEFIPLAEATGHIFAINEWVLEQACKQLKDWHKLGYKMKVAVNISPQQFYHKNDLVLKVKEVLHQYDLDPSYLVIEITEAIAINNMDIAIDKLYELKELGVLIALDDFGTGYSSLSYLTSLPIDTIKIAKEFIDKIGYGSANEAVLSSLVTLGNALNYIIVIEGVETVTQLNKLNKLNCHLMQGFYFSKPLPVDEINKILQDSALKIH